MFGSGQETLPDVRQLSRSPLGCPEVVERPSRMSAIGPETLPDDQKWSKGLPGCPGVIGMPSR